MRIIGIAKARLLGDLLSKSLPYLLIELLLPGGTMFALLLLLWQRRRANASANRQAAPAAFLMTDALRAIWAELRRFLQPYGELYLRHDAERDGLEALAVVPAR